jgi:hypothetical protein
MSGTMVVIWHGGYSLLLLDETSPLYQTGCRPSNHGYFSKFDDRAALMARILHFVRDTSPEKPTDAV